MATFWPLPPILVGEIGQVPLLRTQPVTAESPGPMAEGYALTGKSKSIWSQRR